MVHFKPYFQTISHTKVFAVACLICLLQVQQTNAQIILVIDNFSSTTPNSVVQDNNPAPGTSVWNNFTTVNPNVIGGGRKLGVDAIATINTEPAAVNSELRIAAGTLSLINDTLTRGSGQVIWDGGANTPANNGSLPVVPLNFTLNQNLTSLAGGNNFYFQYSVLNTNGRPWDITIRAYTSAGDFFTNTTTVPAGSFGLFSIFSGNFSSVGAADWSNINAFSLSIPYPSPDLVPPGYGAQFAIQSFGIAVPEPTAYVMIAGSLFVLGYFRYSRYIKSQALREAATHQTVEQDTVDSAGNAVLAPCCHAVAVEMA